MLINRINFLHDIFGMEVVRNRPHGQVVTSAPSIPYSLRLLAQKAGESQVGFLWLLVCGWIILAHATLDSALKIKHVDTMTQFQPVFQLLLGKSQENRTKILK